MRFIPWILSKDVVLAVQYSKSRISTTDIGDRPIGAGVAAATPDKERNLSTRNQKVMNKELFIIIKQFMMPERQS